LDRLDVALFGEERCRGLKAISFEGLRQRGRRGRVVVDDQDKGFRW
jgi:hypothetical protein